MRLSGVYMWCVCFQYYDIVFGRQEGHVVCKNVLLLLPRSLGDQQIIIIKSL